MNDWGLTIKSGAVTTAKWATYEVQKGVLEFRNGGLSFPDSTRHFFTSLPELLYSLFLYMLRIFTYFRNKSCFYLHLQ